MASAAVAITIVAAFTFFNNTARSPEAARRSECMSHLKAIAAAVEMYAAEHGGQWPTDIFAVDGRPLLSWRVRILGQLGYSQLYRRFDLQQAWNSPANRAAVSTMPDVYRCPTAGQFLTDQGLRASTDYFLVQSADGTLCVREIGQFFVVWARPTALNAAEFATIERIASSMHPDWNNSETCDVKPAMQEGHNGESTQSVRDLSGVKTDPPPEKGPRR